MQLNTAYTLANMITAVRQDLLDLDPTTERWSDAVLAREIDRALDTYSFVSPSYSVTQIPTITQCRLYPTPAGAWWIERAEYPVGQWPKSFLSFAERTSPLIAPPTWPSSAPLQGTAAGGGSLNGTYKYALTYAVPGNPNGETLLSSTITVSVPTGSQITLTNIPAGPYGVSARSLYRTVAGGSSLLFLAQIADNATANYVDNTGDASLGAGAPTSNTTANIPQFELLLSASQLPADTTGWIEITYAAKHTLDGTGTTIPEKHWDTIALGAEAFALYAYLAGTNDNLDYVDGQFRDRVDDSKAPLAWRTHAKDTMQRFKDRLDTIRSELQFAYGVDRPHWGDRPVRWERV